MESRYDMYRSSRPINESERYMRQGERPASEDESSRTAAEERLRPTGSRTPAERGSEPPKKRRKIIGKPWMALRLAAISVFLVFLLIAGIATPDRESSELENRTLQTFPKMTWTSLTNGSWMTRFESYMSDQIPFRDKFVSIKSTVSRAAGKSEQNGVYIGKDGWLFEAPSDYSEEKTGKTISAINAFCDKYPEQKITFMLIPNSTYIVKKKLPTMYHPASQAEQIERVYGELTSSVDVKFDAATVLSSDGNPEQLYYRTDHHWTTKAAKLVFDAAAEGLLPGIETPVSYNSYTVSDSFQGTLASSSGIHSVSDSIEVILPTTTDGDYLVTNSGTGTKTATLFDTQKLNTTNQYEVFLGGNFSKVTVDTPADNDRVLLILKDSYANAFIPLLTPYFHKIIIVDARYSTESIDSVMNSADITDILFLYNVNTFLEDTSLKDILA